MNQPVSVVFAIHILMFKRIWVHNLFFEISNLIIMLGLCKNAYLRSVGRCVPQILTFWVLTELYKREMHSSEKKILGRYSDMPAGWFWQWCAKLVLAILSGFVIPWRFCILYEYKSKQLRKTRYIVDLDMFKRDPVCLTLICGFFPNEDRTYSMYPSLIHGIPLPPLWKISILNKSCIPTWDRVTCRRCLPHNSIHAYLRSSNLTRPNLFANNTSLFSVCECHFANVFQVMELNVKLIGFKPENIRNIHRKALC